MRSYFKLILVAIVVPLVGCSQNVDSTSKKNSYAKKIENALFAKDYKTAIVYLDSLIALEPSYDLLYNIRGYCHVYSGHINDKYNDSCAIVDFSAAISLNSTEAYYYHNRADIYVIQNEYELAELDFKQALERSPDNLKYLKSYLKVKMLSNQNEIAMQLADELIAKYPEDGYAYYIRGNLKRDYLHKYVEGNVDVKKGQDLGWNGGFGLILQQ